MTSLPLPVHLLLMIFAGWVNRHQRAMIDYLQEENRVLKERLGDWASGAFASPTSSAADSREKPTHSGASIERA